MNEKTAPDWFYQSAYIQDSAGQYVILYFTTKDGSDEIVSVLIQDRQTSRNERVPGKAFLARFTPIQDEDELVPVEKPLAKKERERVSLL